MNFPTSQSLIFLFLTTILLANCSTINKLQKRPIGLINNVAYTDTRFDNANAANGFLVEHQEVTYGITAKHILMLAKTDKMEFVDFAGELKSWRMHPQNDSTRYAIMKELLNKNQTDSLTWDYMFSNWETYNDWLIFSVQENSTKHKPLVFRTQPLEVGEELYIVGWSYSDTTGAQRVYEYQFESTEGHYHNLLEINGPKSLGGLSGAPILDKKGKLVGLVTSGGEDEATQKVYIQATRGDRILEAMPKK